MGGAQASFAVAWLLLSALALCGPSAVGGEAAKKRFGPSAATKVIEVPADASEPRAELGVLRGLGGYTKGFRRWDGFVARVFGGGGAFGVMGPPGGCSSTAGRRSKTSVTARLGACDYAVNGGPFSMDTGACLGHSVSAGVPVCPDCTVGGFGALGLRRGSGGGNATWVMAPAGLEWEDAEAMNVTELISGFSMLVSESKALPQKGNRAREIAPRTALGLDARGVLIVLEVDGCEKCPASVGGPQGLTLAELADEMVKLGAVYALNLDGGGSSTTVVHGEVADWPTSKDVPLPHPLERDVSTVVCIRAPTASYI